MARAIWSRSVSFGLVNEVVLPGAVRRDRHEGPLAAGEGDVEGRAHRCGHVRDAGQAIPRSDPTRRRCPPIGNLHRAMREAVRMSARTGDR